MTRRLVILAILALGSIAHAQPVTSGGIKKVQHGVSLTGDGTIASPLSVRSDCSTSDTIQWNGTAWVCAAASGAVADGDKGDIVVSGTGTVWTIDTNVVTDTKLRQGAATSVIGRSAGTLGNVADIASTADGDVLRRASGTLGWGAIPEASVTSLTSDLAARPTGSGTSTYLAAFSGTNTITTAGPGTQISGTTFNTAFFGSSTNEDTYLRAGKSAGILYLGDVETGGVRIGAAANATSVLGALSVTGVFDVDNDLAKFGATDGSLYVSGGVLSAGYTVNATTDLSINFGGYLAGVTQFRNTTFYDGKGAVACALTASSKTFNCTGGLQVNGTSVVTTANVSGTSGRTARFTGTNTVGNGAMFDDGSRVGVGIAAPASDSLAVLNTMHVTDNTGAYLRFGAGSSTTFIESGSSLTSGTSAALKFTNMSAAATWAQFDSSGNFTEFNNTTLGDAFTDTATLNGTTYLSVSSTNTTLGGTDADAAVFTNFSNTTNNFSELVFKDHNSSAAGEIAMRYVDQTNHYGQLQFATRGSGGFLERTRIDETGKLTQFYDAEVDGNTVLGNADSDTLTERGAATFRFDSGAPGSSPVIIQNRNISAAGDYAAIRGQLASGAGTGVDATYIATATENSTFTGATADAALWFGTALDGATPAERMRIKSTGAVQVGDVGTATVADSVDLMTLGQTGTGQTLNGQGLLKLSDTGSYIGNSTTRTKSYAMKIDRAASCSDCTVVNTKKHDDVGLWIDMNGDQTGDNAVYDIAMQVNRGDVWFNSNTTTGQSVWLGGGAIANGTYGFTSSKIQAFNSALTTTPSGATTDTGFSTWALDAGNLHVLSNGGVLYLNDSISNPVVIGGSSLTITPDVTIHSTLSGSTVATALNLGNATTSTTAADVGTSWTLDRNTGAVYWDTKVGTIPNNLTGRIGGGTAAGSTNTWIQVDASSGNVALPHNLDAQGTIANSTADVKIADGLNISGAATSANGLLSIGVSGTDATFSQRGAAGSNIIFKTSTAGGVETTALTITFGQGLTVAGNIAAASGTVSAAAVTTTGAINGWTQLTQASDQDVTNSATLTDSTNLQITVTAGKVYALDGYISAAGSDTTGDYKWGLAVAAGTMDCSGTQESLTTADAIQDTTVIATAAATTNATSVGTRADATIGIGVRFSVVCKVSNTTTLKFQFAEATATSTKVARTQAGSYLKYKQLN